MKKLFLTLCSLFIAISMFPQEHIKFNGATFGCSLDQFINSLNKCKNPYIDKNSYGQPINHDFCNLTEIGNIVLNSSQSQCYVCSSKRSNTVFRTITLIGSDRKIGLRNKLRSIVEVLENKYGSGYSEKNDNLGYITSGAKYKEMLALYYYIKNSGGKVIGEIRISCSPELVNNFNDGIIELSYTDIKASELAKQEAKAAMNDCY